MTPQEFQQVVFSAEGADDLAPELLTEAAMRAKLALLGVAENSELGRQALAGGPLFARDGHFRLSTPANIERLATARSTASNNADVGAVFALLEPKPRTLQARAADAYADGAKRTDVGVDRRDDSALRLSHMR